MDRTWIALHDELPMRRLRFCSVVLASILFAVSARASDASKSVHFVTDPEKDGGFLIEITRAAFQRMGYTVTVQFMPWLRALRSVESGNAEALLGAYHTAERAERMQYTDSIGVSEIVFFKRKDSDIAYSRLEDLKPYSIGTIIGASYTPEFDAAAYLNKEAVSSHERNINKLLAGRVALLVEKRLVVLNTLAALHSEAAANVIALEPPLKTALFFNAFSRKFPDYQRKVADFNTGLEMIRKDGTVKKILANAMHE
jgi:polar amino acid transport system substrate-binding protein